MNKTRMITTDYLVSLEGGEVGSASLLHCAGLHGDDGAVGVGDQAVEAVGVGEGGDGVDGTAGSGVGGPGGHNLGGVVGNHGAVSVGHEGCVGVRDSSVRGGVVVGDGTAGVVVGQLSGGHGGGVGGHHGAVGEGDQLGGGEGHHGRENLGQEA